MGQFGISDEGDRPASEAVTRRLANIVSADSSASETVICKMWSQVVPKGPMHPVTNPNPAYSHTRDNMNVNITAYLR
jgi:hypothetical protein